jgi:RHS repeat-associated protein
MTQSLLSPTSISSTNNRINATGWSYDAAGHGNVAKDPSNRTYAYDSENRMVAVCTSDPGGCVNAVAAGRTLYEYDADGRRVRKTDATGSTIYVYDAMGQLAAEYGGNQAGERSYLTADQLGSTRVISAADKTITACRDYTPFGEQVMPVSGDFRNSGCYAADAGVKQEFTGKERDGESGLDYFGARYLSSAQGRFTSPDEPFADQYPEEPQSWNLYTYGRNNPLRFTDPDGHCTADGETHNFIWCAAHSFGIVQTYKEQVADARTNLSQMHGFTISGQTPAEIAKSGSAQQVLAAQKQVDSFLLGVAVDSIALCPRGVSCGVALGEGDEFENLADTKGTVHVLEGDSTGGGHAPGLGISGKSEFPAGWSNEKIMHNISDIATDPKSRVQKLGKTTIIEGSRDGVDIKVVVRDGRIVTGYPTNTPRNP